MYSASFGNKRNSSKIFTTDLKFLCRKTKKWWQSSAQRFDESDCDKIPITQFLLKKIFKKIVAQKVKSGFHIERHIFPKFSAYSIKMSMSRMDWFCYYTRFCSYSLPWCLLHMHYKVIHPLFSEKMLMNWFILIQSMIAVMRRLKSYICFSTICTFHPSSHSDLIFNFLLKFIESWMSEVE